MLLNNYQIKKKHKKLHTLLKTIIMKCNGQIKKISGKNQHYNSNKNKAKLQNKNLEITANQAKKAEQKSRRQKLTMKKAEIKFVKQNIGY